MEIVLNTILPYNNMGKTVIQNLMSSQNIGSSGVLYRIQNLRILEVQGTTLTNVYIPESDRPKTTILGSGIAAGPTLNLGLCMGRLAIESSGKITCLYASDYHSQSTGFDVLTGSDTFVGVAVWEV